MDKAAVNGFYDTLIARGQCPAGCSLCETACAAVKANSGKSRILISRDDTGLGGVVKCNQCSEPECLAVCPTRAISKSDVDGVVRINEEKCVGCGLCGLACPYGGMHYDPATAKAAKCDNCGGDPKCVAACPHGVLTYSKNRSIRDTIGVDHLARGGRNCMGCGVELSIRSALKALGNKDIVVLTGPGCCARILVGYPEGVPIIAPVMVCLMTNISSCMTGITRYYQKVGKDVTCVCLIGDGATSDVGFQPLSGAAERNEKILYICVDNEVYGATGYQRSGTTPFLSWTSTTPIGLKGRGKSVEPKNIPLLLAMHGISYSATASVAFLEDFVEKLKRAKEATKEGMAYLHLLSPCPTGWRSAEDKTVQLGRMAVETNYFPLWEAHGKKFRFTYRPQNPRPVEEFTRLMGRFSHLDKVEVAQFQSVVNEKFKFIESLAAIGELDEIE